MPNQLLSKDALSKVCEMYYKYLKNWDEKLILTYKSNVPHIYYEWDLVAIGNDCVIVLINFYQDYEDEVCKDDTKRIDYIKPVYPYRW